MSYHFGAGNLYAINAVGGVSSGVKFGALQEFSVDFSFNQKELYGQSSFPLTVARGQGKITGKAKNGSIVARLWNQVFFGAAASAGQIVASIGEAGVPLGNAAFILQLANGAQLREVLAVVDAVTGAPFTRVANPGGTIGAVAAALASGTYCLSVAGTGPGSGNGSLQFAAADADRAVLIDYTYGVTSGSTLQLTNQQTGVAPAFAIVAQMPYEGRQALVRLNRVYAPKLAFGTKLEDFVVPEFDFMCAADAAGQIGLISLPD